MAEETKLPKHIAIIMDGNGRWAKKRFMPRSFGHSAGGERFVDTVKVCDEWGIEYLTVYALSTENWSRAQEEVSALITLMHSYMKKYMAELMKRNIRLRIMGDLTYFDEESRNALIESENALSANTGMTLCIAVSYGGRHEIVEAAKKLIERGETDIDEDDFASCLYSSGIPDPDLIIRTGGDLRISNFLLWQSAYAEYYFTDTLWPDFDENKLAEAIKDFGGRKRKYGK